jgi:hypothetical protein
MPAPAGAVSRCAPEHVGLKIALNRVLKKPCFEKLTLKIIGVFA